MGDQFPRKDWKQVRTVIPTPLFMQARGRAEEEGRTMSGLLRQALSTYLKGPVQPKAADETTAALATLSMPAVWATGDRVWVKHKHLDTDEMMTSPATVVPLPPDRVMEGCVGIEFDHARGDVRRYRANSLRPIEEPD